MNISKSTANLGCDSNSLRAALNIMKGLGHKSKQVSVSAHELAKELYEYTMNFLKKNGSGELELDQIDDFLETPQATCQILLALKQNLRIVLPLRGFSVGTSSTSKDSTSQDTNEPTLINQIKVSEIKIKDLEDKIQENDRNFKHVQLKLLNNIKKLNQQIHDKNLMLQERQLQLNELREILEEKQQELESMTKINEKKYRRIRELEQDLYDMQQQNKLKQSQLVAEKNCSGLMEKKLTKLIEESMISGQGMEQNNQSASFSFQFNLASELANNNQDCLEPQFRQKISETGIQTEETQLTNDGTVEIHETIKGQYLESIEILTGELGEAYQRINQMTKNKSDVAYSEKFSQHDQKVSNKIGSII